MGHPAMRERKCGVRYVRCAGGRLGESESQEGGSRGIPLLAKDARSGAPGEKWGTRQRSKSRGGVNRGIPPLAKNAKDGAPSNEGVKVRCAVCPLRGREVGGVRIPGGRE